MDADALEAARRRMAQAERVLAASIARRTQIDETAQRVADNIRGTLWKSSMWRGGWKVVELIVERSFASAGTVAYLLVSLIGLAYSYGYYERFKDIEIFTLFETSDFLLSAFGNLGALAWGFSIPLVIAGVLAASYFAETMAHARYVHTKGVGVVPIRVFLAVSLTVAVAAPFGIPFAEGTRDSKNAFKPDKLVRVTLRQDSDTRRAQLPEVGHTVLLGTTSGFHIFHECKNDLRDEIEQREAADSGQSPNHLSSVECDDGESFVVPTANVGSVSFDVHGKDDIDSESSTAWRSECRSTVVGHFPEGAHLPDENALDESIGAAYSWIQKQKPDRLMFVGRVDKKRLDPDKHEAYGSDLGLAQARAVWVQAMLKQRAEEDEAKSEVRLLRQAMLLSGGPKHVGTLNDVTDCQRSSDRVVEIWACGVVAGLLDVAAESEEPSATPSCSVSEDLHRGRHAIGTTSTG